MVSAYAIQDFNIEIDEESEKVVLTIIGASGNKHIRVLGEFNRVETIKGQRKNMLKMNEEADRLRVYFLEYGQLPQ